VSSRQRAVLTDVVQFVALTFALSSLFAMLIIRAGHIASGRSLFTRGLMWSPGVAALIMLKRRGTSFREIGWGWTGQWEWIAYVAVMLAGILVYGLAWITGIAGFPDQAQVQSIATDFGWRQLPTSIIVGGYATLMLTLGMVPAITAALGEEIGWRGYLVPRLSSAYGFRATALISGGIWAVWHYPMFIVSDYYRGGRLWYSLACFTILLLSASVICTWLRLKSGSIWPAVILHGANNLLVQDVLRPLSVNGPWSHYVLDQFGGVLPLMTVVVAVMVWQRRADVEGIRLERAEGDAEVLPSLQRIA
jgi:membrane protease YdiL (CAAX protease family)